MRLLTSNKPEYHIKGVFTELIDHVNCSLFFLIFLYNVIQLLFITIDSPPAFHKKECMLKALPYWLHFLAPEPMSTFYGYLTIDDHSQTFQLFSLFKVLLFLNFCFLVHLYLFY